MNLLVNTLQKWIEEIMHFSVQNLINFSKENNISMPQLGTLMQIHHGENFGVSDIGTKFGVSSAAASQMIEKLVQQEIIERTEDPNDRRMKQLALTPKGNNIVQLLIQIRKTKLNEMTEILTPDEQEKLTLILNKMIEKIHISNVPNSTI